MTLEEYYRLTGGDYEQTMTRMMNETLLRRFLGLFAKDDSFAKLTAAMETGEVEAAFTAVHTLKGNALNVGLKNLGDSAAALTDALRFGKMQDAKSLYQQVCKDYEVAVKGLNEIENITAESLPSSKNTMLKF